MYFKQFVYVFYDRLTSNRIREHSEVSITEQNASDGGSSQYLKTGVVSNFVLYGNKITL